MEFLDDLKAKAEDLLGDAKGAFEKAKEEVGELGQKAGVSEWGDKIKDGATDLFDKAKDLVDGGDDAAAPAEPPADAPAA